MNINRLLLATAFVVAGPANAAILSPTDQDMNFFNICFSCDTTGLELGLFDDSVVNFAGQPWLRINVAGDIVDFSPTIGQNSDYFLTNNAYDTTPGGVYNTLTLTGNDNFQLALRRGLPGDGDFIPWSLADSSVCSSTTNSCILSWDFGTSELVVDVNPIPVPAAAWLLGSGLIGLVGIARRKAA